MQNIYKLSLSVDNQLVCSVLYFCYVMLWFAESKDAQMLPHIMNQLFLQDEKKRRGIFHTVTDRERQRKENMDSQETMYYRRLTTSFWCMTNWLLISASKNIAFSIFRILPQSCFICIMIFWYSLICFSIWNEQGISSISLSFCNLEISVNLFLSNMKKKL